MEDRSDAELIAASLREPVFFGAIFDRHATVLHRYFVRRLGPDEAESLVGEVFRVAFEKRHAYDLLRPTARPWLYGIATNLVAKHRRKEARRVHAMARMAAERSSRVELADQVSSAVDASEQWPRVAEVVTSLPRTERDALILHVWEGMTYEEVAATMDVPVGTVRSRLHSARRRLRELSDARGGEQSDTPSGRMRS